MSNEEQLATIRRVCAASGILVAGETAVDCVKMLAREHAGRGAMVGVLHLQANQAPMAPAPSTYTSEPLPDRHSAFYAGDRYFANEEDARRARLELRADPFAYCPHVGRIELRPAPESD